jgi:hypothetical protein
MNRPIVRAEADGNPAPPLCSAWAPPLAGGIEGPRSPVAVTQIPGRSPGPAGRSAGPTSRSRFTVAFG